MLARFGSKLVARVPRAGDDLLPSPLERRPVLINVPFDFGAKSLGIKGLQHTVDSATIVLTVLEIGR